MKIGIIGYPRIGGAGGVATSLAQELAKSGHDIHLISYDVPFSLGQFWPKNITLHRVDITEYPDSRESPYVISLATKIAEVVQEEKLEIVHSHYAMPHAIAAQLACGMMRRKPKLIVTFHGTDVSLMGKDPNIKGALVIAIRQSDALTAVSEALARQAEKNFELPRSPRVIENFVTTQKIPRSRLRGLRKIFASPKEKILIHISNFRPIKRIGDVVKIFRNVQKEIPSRLLLVGDGPEMSRIKRVVKRAGLQSRVYFLGFQLDVSKMLSVSDLLLFPSEQESFGLVAAEAMACGVPVISTTTVGLAPAIFEYRTGLLSKAGNVAQMSRHAIELLTHHEKWLSMSMNAMRLVNERYRPEHIVPQYEALYRELLKKRRG